MACEPGSRVAEYAVVDRIVYKGIEYRRYPNAKRRNNRVYYVATGGAHLHRVIYKEHYGPIPDGWHVHHKDDNPLNNDPGNLEALPRSRHARHHLLQRPEDYWDRQKQHLATIRPLASDWHKSESGRQWHRKHGEGSWSKVQPQEWACQECGKTFLAKPARLLPKFCSGSCSTKNRRKSGVDDETRTCVVCGHEYRCNKYLKSTCCGLKCSGRRSQWVRRGTLKPHPGDQ